MKTGTAMCRFFIFVLSFPQISQINAEIFFILNLVRPGDPNLVGDKSFPQMIAEKYCL